MRVITLTVSDDKMEFNYCRDIISNPPVVNNSLTTQQTDWRIDRCLLWQPLRCLSNTAVMTAGDCLFAAVTFCLLSSCPPKISFIQRKSRRSAPSSLQRCGLSVTSSGFACVWTCVLVCVLLNGCLCGDTPVPSLVSDLSFSCLCCALW